MRSWSLEVVADNRQARPAEELNGVIHPKRSSFPASRVGFHGERERERERAL